MKKLSLILIMGFLPISAFAARTNPDTCEQLDAYGDVITEIPSGYCCISYTENGSSVERLWNCDNLDLDASSMAACKSERTNCINYCVTYDLDNNTCSTKPSIDPCEGWQEVDWPVDSPDCTIPNAETCEYTLVCDLCGDNCYHENEEVTTCIDGYYNTEDFKQCLKCPGNGIVDYDAGNIGIAQCYIPRGSMTGSDETGTFKYVSDKCYYRE